MTQYTAAEVLMISEAIRAASAAARFAQVEAQMVQDPQLKQFLQGEAQRHQQAVQRLQALLPQA